MHNNGEDMYMYIRILHLIMKSYLPNKVYLYSFMDILG